MVNGRNGKRDCEDSKMMKQMVTFLLFILYTIGIFLIQHPLIIVWGIGINLICMLIQRISIKKAISNLWSFMGFIVFTGVINVWVVDFHYGAMIAIKLMLVCNVTYLFSKSITYTQFAQIMVRILTPLKWGKCNTNQIEIMICIALSAIPILKQELVNVRFALKAKGCKTDAFHLILQAKWVLLPMLTSILKRMNEMEHTLKAKAYLNE